MEASGSLGAAPHPEASWPEESKRTPFFFI